MTKEQPALKERNAMFVLSIACSFLVDYFLTGLLSWIPLMWYWAFHCCLDVVLDIKKLDHD